MRYGPADFTNPYGSWIAEMDSLPDRNVSSTDVFGAVSLLRIGSTFN
jgi:hypothetical protein